MKTAKYFLLAFISLLFIRPGMAQIKYEDLDKCSKVINEIQGRAQPFSCGDERISFPDESIRFLITKNLFSYAFFSFSQRQGDESLLLNDAVDLSDVREISVFETPRCGEYIKVYFSKAVYFENINTTKGRTGYRSTSEVGFYFNNASKEDKDRLFKSLVDITFHVKANSPSGNKAKAEEELRAWNKTVSENQYVAYTGFVKNYPNSILANEAKQRAEKLALGDRHLTKFFTDYFAKSNRSAKYQKLWGNWMPNRGIQAYAGKTKDLKVAYLQSGYNFNVQYKGEKHTYSNAGVYFEFYSYDVDAYDNSRGIDNNTIEISRKTDLIPAKVGFNDRNNVVYMAYKVRSKEDLPMYDISEYFGLGLESDKRSSSGGYEHYHWYFDDCTIVYFAEEIDPGQMVGRAKTNPSDYVKVYFHDKRRAVPSSTYKFTKDGKAYEISPQLWKKLIEQFD